MTTDQFINHLAHEPLTIEITAKVSDDTWLRDKHVALPEGMVPTVITYEESHVSSVDYPILRKWFHKAQWYFPGLQAIPVVNGTLVKHFDAALWNDRVLIADSIPFKIHKHTQIILTAGGLRIRYDKGEALETAKRNVLAADQGKGYVQLNVPVNGYSWEDHYRKYGDDSVRHTLAIMKSMLGGFYEKVTSTETKVPTKVSVGSFWKYCGYTARTLECVVVFGCWAVIGKIIVSHIK